MTEPAGPAEPVERRGARHAPPAGYLGTLGKGLRVLVLLQRGPASVSRVARELGMDRTGTFRIMRTLEHHGFVSRTDTGDYRLGLRLWELGAQVFGDGDVVSRSAEFVDWLLAATQETVHVAIYDEGRVVYVVKRDGTAPIGSYTRLGGSAPAYCVATGKALLAHREPAEVETLLAAGLTRYTPRTITSAEALWRELDGVCRDGFAVNRGEWRAEVGGVAAAIRRTDGRAPAAIGVSGPVDRIIARLDTYSGLVVRAARELSERLEGFG